MSPNSHIDDQVSDSISEKKRFIEFIDTKKDESGISSEPSEKKVTLKQAIIANLIVAPIALGIYLGFELTGPYYLLNETYYFHALLSFCCFFVLPVLYQIIFHIITGRAKYLFFTTRKGLEPKNVLNSLLQGCAMHAGLFFPWVALAQIYLADKVNSLEFAYFLPKPMDWFYHILFVALNVMMFEYYSKAFVQIQFSEAEGAISLFRGKLVISGGKKLGLVLTNILWIFGHIPEFLWLQYDIGPVNAVFFILIAGILTSYTVWHTENIFGVTIGHVLLNVLITVAYT